MNLIDKVNLAIEMELIEKYQEEAKNLIKLTDESRLEELLLYSESAQGHLFCLCLDSIKFNLVKENKIKDSDYPSFGYKNF